MESTQNQKANIQQLPQVNPTQFTVDIYLNLVRELHKTGTESFDREIFKQADQLLGQFSKTHQAWAVIFQVLTMPSLNENEYFHAANILKNKMMYDFASLKVQDFNVAFQMRDNLISKESLIDFLVILKNFANNNGPTFIINSLCTAFAILIMHIHQIWSNSIEQLTMSFSENPDQAVCLLLILKYLASDCDNDSIVIEDSIRTSFFNYLDQIAPQVFTQIFNAWAQKINEGKLAEVDYYKLMRLKSKLIDSFYNWIKIRLPDQVFANMTNDCPQLIKLIFDELESQDETMENATNCVIELILLAKKKKEFESIRNAVIQKVEHLKTRVQEAVDEQDLEKGESLSDIFVELGCSHIQQIIEGNAIAIPQILLSLLTIQEINSRRQVSFWKTLFKSIYRIQDQQVKSQKLQVFGPILQQLLEIIVKIMMAEDEIFEEFNYKDDQNEEFDDFFLIRGDFGRLIQTICRCYGGAHIYQQFFKNKLEEAIRNAQEDLHNPKNWSQIECILSCIAEIIQTLSSQEVSILKEPIIVIFQLPDNYVALRVASTRIILSLSKLLKEHGIGAAGEIKQFTDYVVKGLNNKFTANISAECFNKLCIENANVLTNYAAELIEKILPNPATEWSYKKNYTYILDGFSAIIEKQQDSQLAQVLMTRTIQPFVLPLLENINKLKQVFAKEGRRLKKAEINDHLLNSMYSYLQLIGDFLKGCQDFSKREPNPYENVFRELWTLIQQILIEFTHLDDIVESTCRLVKHSLRVLKSKFNPYLIPFLQIVIKAYEQNPISSFIYSAEFCLVEYGKQIEYESILLETFEIICKQSATFLVDLDAFVNYPDLVYDFFGMCIRYLRYSKHIFFRSQNLETLLKLWIFGIGIQHKEAVSTHSQFFVEIVNTIRNDISQLQNINDQNEIVSKGINQNEINVWNYFLQNGQEIVDKYFNVILNAPPRDITEKYDDVLVTIIMSFPTENRQLWFQNDLKKVTNDILTEEEKVNFLSKIINPENKDDIYDHVEVINRRARNAIHRPH